MFLLVALYAALPFLIFMLYEIGNNSIKKSVSQCKHCTSEQIIYYTYDEEKTGGGGVSLVSNWRDIEEKYPNDIDKLFKSDSEYSFRVHVCKARCGSCGEELYSIELNDPLKPEDLTGDKVRKDAFIDQILKTRIITRNIIMGFFVLCALFAVYSLFRLYIP